MSITSLIHGKLISEPKSGQSASGKAWCRASVACSIQRAKEDEPDSLIVSLVAFGDEAKKLERLNKADAVSAVGQTKLNHWIKGGETKTGIDLLASQILSPYQLRQKRPQTKEESQFTPEQKQAAQRFYSRQQSSGGEPSFVDDEISF